MRFKQMLALLLSVLFLFALAGCGEPAAQDGKQDTAVSEEAKPMVLPDYVGFTLEGATFYLENEYKVVKTAHESLPENVIYKTEPAAGAEITPDTVITFYVSIGQKGEASATDGQ